MQRVWKQEPVRHQEPEQAACASESAPVLLPRRHMVRAQGWLRKAVMRVAAIYDNHGNLPALEAVLDEIQQAGVDSIVVGGDVLPGPMPRETIACLLHLSIPMRCIYGNGEIATLEQMAGKEPVAVPEPHRPVIQWTAEQLDDKHDRLLSAWPKTLRLQLQSLGEVLFCHATPRSENEIFTRRTPEERLLPIFEGLGAAVVVCGHTHMQFDRMIGTTRVLNAGSVGMPFGEPGAYWLLLGPSVEFRQTLYDFTKAAERIRATSYPQAEAFAAQNILQPPSRDKMLAAFTRAELK
jgi:predicted phosphodiesterase